MVVTVATNPQVADATLPNDDLARLRISADLTGILPSGKRKPLIRTGEREPIPWITRCAVYYRDGGTCQRCGAFRPAVTHMDHIIPWSSGGSDHGGNLRTLCEPCNLSRSNYDDGADRIRKLPVTWWCIRCYLDDYNWWYHGHGSGGCRARSACRVPRINKTEPDFSLRDAWYFEQRPVNLDRAHTFAYCAHCDTQGYTDVTL